MVARKILVILAAFGLSLLVALLISTAAALALIVGLAFVGLVLVLTGKYAWLLPIIASIAAFALKLMVI